MNINSLKIFGLLIIILTTVVSACGESDTATPMPTPTPTLTPTPTPTPTPAPCQDVSRKPRRLESTEPFVHLYAPKVNVTAGEEFSLHLGALNPTGTGGNLDVTLVLTVPSGISIEGSDFGTSVQGFTHNTHTFTIGDSREIGIHMSAGAPPIDQQVENHRITGQVSWKVEGSDQSFDDCYEVALKVSHNPVELTFDLTDLPDDADVGVASPGACSESENNSCSLPYGSEQELNINLNEEDYIFIRYDYQGSRPRDVNSRDTAIPLTENTTITPLVEKVAVYTLSLRGDPEEAGSAKVESMDCSPSCKIKENQPFTISAVSEPGQIFKVWESSDISIPDPNAERVEGLMLSGDTTITARFLRELTLTTKATEGGYVEVEEAEGRRNCAGGCVHREDTRLKVLATANSGWQFVEWKYSGSEPMSLNDATNATTHITLIENATVTAVFKPARMLTITTEGQGTVISPSDCSDGCVHPEDASLDMVAIASDGWQFVEWRHEKGSRPSRPAVRTTQITITEDTIITAVFKKAFTLTLNRSEGGTVSAMPDCCTYIDGTEIDLQAVPHEGYRFIRWQSISGGTPSGSGNSASITITENTILTAIFERPPVTLTLNAGEGGGGTVFPKSCRNNGCQRDYGEMVDIIASPNTGWTFVRWEYSGSIPNSLTAAGTDITLTEDTTVTAVFDVMPPGPTPTPTGNPMTGTVTLTLSAGAGGAVSSASCLNNSCEKANGEMVNITATPDTGWSFVRWEYSGSGPNSINSAETSVTLTGNTAVTAIFEHVTVTLTLTTNQGGALLPSSCRDDGCQRDYGDSVNITATPDAGWAFVRWEYSGSRPNSLTAAGTSIMLTEDTTVTAVFERVTVTLILRTSTGGTVLPASCLNNSCEQTHGDSVNITARPNTGWAFDRWEYSGSRPNSPTAAGTSIILTEDTTVTAVFERATVTLILTTNEGGSLSPASCRNNGCQRDYGDSVNITARPNTGWAFVRWEYSGSRPNSLTAAGTSITLTEDTTVTAVFERVTVTLVLGTSTGGAATPASCRNNGCEKTHSERVNIIATPDTGWTFVRWEYSGSRPNSLTAAGTGIILTEDTTVTAVFERVTVTLILTTSGGGAASPALCRNNGCQRDYGDRVNITAAPNTGWIFDRWEVVSGSTPSGFDSDNKDHTITLNGDVTLRLRFVQGEETGPPLCSGIPPAECRALEALYNATDGDNWTNNTDWLDGGNPNQWYGVRVSNGGVTEIDLGGNNLVGTLSSSIGRLTNLTTLRLGRNNFSGVLPPEIGELTNLTIAYLGRNGFSGVLPPEIGRLTNLTALGLSNNNFSGKLPPEIGDLTNLTELNLSSNNFNGALPPEIGDLVNLTLLNLSDNNFSPDIPSCSVFIPITECEALVDFYNVTDGDNWTNNSGWLDRGDPNQWQGVQVLNGRVTEIDLRSNNLTGTLPSSIGHFTNLTTLLLGRNSFSGELPPEIGELTNLTIAYLGSNGFSGELPPEIGGLTNLTALGLSNNNFSGELPSEIGELTKLTELNLSANRFSGELPTEIDNLVNLTLLNLTDNNFSCSVFIPVTECEALAGLYNATDGDNWGNNSGWLDGGDLNQWEGVQVLNGRVTRISLFDNNLTGALPSSIGNFANLTELTLAGNNFSGELPSSIGNLTNLTWLNLVGNNFSGELPSSIGNLTNLTWLNLVGNNFSGELPSSIGNLTNLTALSLSYNNFSGELPTEIGELTNLTFLGLSNNNFSGELPTEIGELTNLTELRLYANDFSGELPPEIGNLVNLGSRGSLSSLGSLGLSNNKFSGRLPPSIGNLTNLNNLDLSNNNFSGGLPPEIGNLTGLRRLSLSNNNFSGELPSEIGNLTNLKRLDLQQNEFSGELPPSILTITHLRYDEGELYPPACRGIPVTECEALVDLYNATNGDNWTSNNGWLDGGDPNGWVGVQVNNGRVTRIDLFHNNLIGTLPSSIGDLTNLTTLRLGGKNNFSGELPPEIGNLTNLTALELHNNNFSGELPPEIGNLTDLRGLSLFNNNFSGELPPEIGNLTDLRSLHLSNNNFSGELPPEIGNLVNLRSLSLDNFSGELPPEIGNLVNLRYLTLDNFSGELPPEIGNLDDLHLILNNFSGELPPEIGDIDNLQLTLNNFSGELPPEIGELDNLQNLTLNNFSGELPPEIGELDNLQNLTLNNFSGELPPEIGNLVNLTFLSLNNFSSGKVPPEIWELTTLTVLNLSSNNFSGELPNAIGNLVNLEGLWLDDNNFSGELPPEIWELTTLTALNLSSNNFSGELPPEIGNLTNLTLLYLRDNNFSGRLPSGICGRRARFDALVVDPQNWCF